MCSMAKERGCSTLITSSGGNAGAAAALAGRLLGMKVSANSERRGRQRENVR